jgi:tetratricopeptide (TPR) repeat protein
VSLGELDKGLDWARQALEIDPGDPMLLYNVACIQSLAGQVEEALDSLERSVKNGLTEKRWLERDSNLDALRRHPRYQALLELIEQCAPAQ